MPQSPRKKVIRTLRQIQGNIASNGARLGETMEMYKERWPELWIMAESTNDGLRACHEALQLLINKL